MIPLSVALKAHYQLKDTTVAKCLKVTLVNGTVLGFTAFNRDIGPISGVTYVAAKGVSSKDIQTNAALNVDNTEVYGPQIFPNITENDLLAGLWDYAYFELFEVNYADLTMGIRMIRAGHLGNVSVERGKFTAELRGLTDAYQRTIGRIDSPTCDAVLGDSRCQADIASMIGTGAVTSVQPDNATFGDTSRAEAGPSSPTAISNITNTNPGTVVLADNLNNFYNGQAVVLSGFTQPALLNTTVVVRNLRSGPSTGQVTFDLPIDTTDTLAYPAYTGGGICSPLGGTSGFFEGGVVTWTGVSDGIVNLNGGLKMEVKSYVPGQFSLQLPMPYLIQVGDTYSVTPGCDKTLPTCRDRYNNVINFRGEPYFPGQDKIVQVGRHNG